MSVERARRYYLLKRLAATLRKDAVMAGVWQAKQEAEDGVLLLSTLTYQSRLVAAGYLAFEDIDGTSVEELQLSGFTAREAESIIASTATEMATWLLTESGAPLLTETGEPLAF